MNTVRYETCTEDQWKELDAALRQHAAVLVDKPVFPLERLTKFHPIYVLNHFKVFLRKTEAWYIGMSEGFHLFYLGKDCTLYTNIWVINGPSLRPVDPKIFPESYIPLVMGMLG